VANLSKTLHINFYQNQSSIVEVMIKKFGVFFMPHSVVVVVVVVIVVFVVVVVVVVVPMVVAMLVTVMVLVVA